MSMTRVELKRAFREATALEFSDVPRNDAMIEFYFSDEFIQKMQKLIISQKKCYWTYMNTVKKRVAIIIVICLSLFVTACSNKAFREPIIQKMEQLEGVIRHYFIDGDVRNEIKDKYYIEMEQEEFNKISEIGDSRWHMVKYEDGVGNSIEFSQYAVDSLEYNVNDQTVNEYSIKVRECEVLIFEYSDFIRAVWIEDGYGMGLRYNGCTDVNVIIEIIETIKIKGRD